MLQQHKDFANTEFVITNHYWDVDEDFEVYEYSLIKYKCYYTYYRLCTSYVDDSVFLYELFPSTDEVELVSCVSNCKKE